MSDKKNPESVNNMAIITTQKVASVFSNKSQAYDFMAYEVRLYLPDKSFVSL
jgi:hypothetical protein